MSDLEPATISALDQFSGVIRQIGDITVAHHALLTDGNLHPDLVRELTGDMHDALIATFVTPDPPRPEQPDD